MEKEMIHISFSSDKIKMMEGTLKDAFNVVREELDDHREAINQSTNEIQTNYEYLCKLDSKIEKLGERIDELTMFIKQLKGQEQKKFIVSRLTRKEQEVFLFVYMNEEITYKEIGRRLALTEELVRCYIGNLTEKGVPILKKRIGEEELITLDQDFKAVQAKENIVGINEEISHTVQNS